jgi:arylsulfatase
VADEAPFVAYLPVAFPHFPTLPHPEFAGVTGNGDFADSFVEADTQVGRLLDLLDELDVADDTVVVVTSDNGAEDVLPWRGWTGPWGGSYFTAMEGSLRVPCIVRWPDHIAPGGVSNEMCHAVDLFTTFAAMGGGVVPDDRPIDGIDLSPFLTGARSTSGREALLCFVVDRLHAIKWRNWKLHLIWQEYMLDPAIELGVPRAFNLYEDPGERHDVFLPDNTWLTRPTMAARATFEESLLAHPAIAPGTPDPYLP